MAREISNFLDNGCIFERGKSPFGQVRWSSILGAVTATSFI